MTQSSFKSPKSYRWTAGLNRLSFAAIGVGIIAFIIGLATDPQRAWANYLVGYFYWFSMSLGGVFFVALQHISGAPWSIPVRRIAASFVSYLPVSLLLFLVLLFGIHHLYEWTDAATVAADPILEGKSGYLNTPFVVVRSLALYLVGIGAGWWMLHNERQQDLDGKVSWSKLNIRISAPFILIFAWLYSFVSVDLMMSLSPHWFSTVFGVYCWSGLFCAMLAMLMLWVIGLRSRGCLEGFVTLEHYHGIGKFMFAFAVFWAYIAFSQYMLIWYANLPEEITYMMARLTPSWEPVSMLLMVGRFGVPFLLLIAQGPKRRNGWMMFMSIWFLLMQWVDVYWMVFPSFYKAPVFGWMEIAIFAGFAGTFMLCVGKMLSRMPVVAYHDPQIAEGVAHQQ